MLFLTEPVCFPLASFSSYHRLASALEKKKSLRPKTSTYETESMLLPEAQACLSQHATPQKVKRSLLDAFEQPEDKNRFEPYHPASQRKTLPWRACLLLSISLSVLAALAAVSVLPITPRVLPLIY